MIPSCVPNELQNLTQIEEMLIAHVLPIMRVYIKPGGQQGYSGHCINLPQNVTDLASLPRYPKHLAVIIVKIKGRDNTIKDVTVQKQKVYKVPSVENEPLNEYQVSCLATMAFPTLFPHGKGNPTNQVLLRDVPLQERIKHFLKFAVIIDG